MNKTSKTELKVQKETPPNFIKLEPKKLYKRKLIK